MKTHNILYFPVRITLLKKNKISTRSMNNLNTIFTEKYLHKNSAIFFQKTSKGFAGQCF